MPLDDRYQLAFKLYPYARSKDRGAVWAFHQPNGLTPSVNPTGQLNGEKWRCLA